MNTANTYVSMLRRQKNFWLKGPCNQGPSPCLLVERGACCGLDLGVSVTQAPRIFKCQLASVTEGTLENAE